MHARISLKGFVTVFVLFVIASLMTSTTIAAGTIYYVDADATGGNGSGDSWANAFTNLQDALQKATAEDQIWVAAGVYYPDVGGGQADNQRSASFTIKAGVALYGGFDPGSGADELSERDWKQHLTVLSGDIDQNDVKDANGIVANHSNIKGSNSNHVVFLDGKQAPITNATVIDGFVITGGKADSADQQPNGGGVYCLGSDGGECSPAFANVTFSGNAAGKRGGAMFNDGVKGDSSPTLTNVIFTGNLAEWGGAVFNDGVNGKSSPSFVNATFKGNLATSAGGAVYNDSSNPEDVSAVSNPSFSNVLFSGNLAAWGGAMYSDGQPSGDASPALVNVTFAGNRATAQGGALYNTGSGEGVSSPSLTNVILWHNSARQGDSIFNQDAEVFIGHSIVENGRESIVNQGDSWVIWDSLTNMDGDPLFVAPVDPSTAPTFAGDLRLQAGSSAIAAGDNFALSPAIQTDLNGTARFSDGTIDIGAYEFVKSAVEWQVQSTLVGHAASVDQVDWSPDGKLVASVSKAGPIVWDANTEEKLTFTSQGENFTSVAWSPDGERLAAGYARGVQLWERESSESGSSWTGPTTPIQAMSALIRRSVAWAPDGASLAVGESNFAIPWKFDGEEWKVGPMLSANPQSVMTVDMSWSPDGRLLLLAGFVNDATVWEWIEDHDGYWQQRDSLVGSKSQVHQFSWSPDGSRLAYIDMAQLKVWDLETDKTTIRFDTQTRPLNSIAWSPDGGRLAMADTGNSSIRILDTESWQVVGTLSVPGDQSMINSLDWSPDGTRLVTGSVDGTVRIWQRVSVAAAENAGSPWQQNTVLTGHERSITGLVWSADGLLLSSSEDGTIRHWDIQSGQGNTVFQERTVLADIAWSEQHSLLAAGQNDGMIRVWHWEDLAAGNGPLVEHTEHSQAISSVAWAPDGEHGASTSWDRTVHVWLTESPESLAVYEVYTDTAWFTDVAWSQDGRLAAGVTDGFVQIWPGISGGPGAQGSGFQAHRSQVTGLSWSPVSGQLATGSTDKTVRIWEWNSESAEWVNSISLRSNTHDVMSLAWSPDGRLIATGSYDGTVRVWDVANARLLANLEGHKGAVVSVVWSQDGRLIASGSWDKTIHIWECADNC